MAEFGASARHVALVGLTGRLTEPSSFAGAPTDARRHLGVLGARRCLQAAQLGARKSVRMSVAQRAPSPPFGLGWVGLGDSSPAQPRCICRCLCLCCRRPSIDDRRLTIPIPPGLWACPENIRRPCRQFQSLACRRFLWPLMIASCRPNDLLG